MHKRTNNVNSYGFTMLYICLFKMTKKDFELTFLFVVQVRELDIATEDEEC